MRVAIQRDPEARDLPLPVYATAAPPAWICTPLWMKTCVLAPGERVLISTGIRIALPEGYEAQVRPRSGLALRHGLALVNSPGTIDSDYRNTISVLLINLGQEPTHPEPGRPDRATCRRSRRACGVG